MNSIENTNYIGRKLDDRYVIKSLVGSGGMSRVFLADDLVLHRELAIKMLREEIAKDEASVKRFIHESKAVLMLSHPNIVSVYDVSIASEEKYIVLEYAEGITLKEYLHQHGPLSADETIQIATQLLSALQHAHSRGVIHRDIKPQNIIVAPDGSIKLTDFGIAKVPNSETISMTDKAIGSVHYISPEQASGLPVDHRSDLYSVGIILYEMICNRVPFEAETAVAVACMQISSQAIPPSEFVPGVPKGLEQVLMKAISKRPADRFENAGQMLACLERLKITPDAVFDFVSVREDAEENVMEATPLEKSVDEGAVQQITTAQDELPETKKRRKKREKIIETEVIYKKSRVSMFPIIFGMLCGFCAVALVVVVYVLQTYFFTDSRNSHVLIVGDYVNQTYDEQFQEELEASGYTITVEWVSSSEYLANTIISQKPEKNARRTLHRGSPTCELTLVVSSGENLLTLPDYTGVEYRQAQLELRRQKVNYVIEKVHSTVVESGMIISTYPKAGTVMGSDTTITLYVSTGADTKFVTIPNLVGLTASQLDAKLKSLELRMGKVSYTYSNVYAPGVVMEQSLVSGVTVQAGITSIDFVVSLGPKIDIPVQTTPPTTTVTPQETVEPTETDTPDDAPSPEDTSEQ